MAQVFVLQHHLTSREVAEELARPQRGYTITDRCAVTIASWYMAPAGNGKVFASFATGCSVDLQDLEDAVDVELDCYGFMLGGRSDSTGVQAVTELGALKRWILRQHELTNA
jgi:hypothetical protein